MLDKRKLNMSSSLNKDFIIIITTIKLLHMTSQGKPMLASTVDFLA